MTHVSRDGKRKKRKIVVFSPPFSGHLNVLKRLIHDHKSDYNFVVIITGWKNIQPRIGGLSVPVKVLAKSHLRESDPGLWTFPRVSELLGDCLQICQKEKPDLLLYDFFSLEGYFVGKILGIPHWSSIPAMVGPFTNRQYLNKKLQLLVNRRATHRLFLKYGIKVDPRHLEMISDGFHVPGEVNLIWSYTSVTPKRMLSGRQKAAYEFIGNPSGSVAKRRKIHPLIYFSLGTVVMDNLWNQHRAVRRRLHLFVSELAKEWNGEPFRILFVNQGKKILPHYPANWRVVTHTNQIEALSQADVFVTHGGSNSFHEALLNQVPMVYVPFFGDQFLVAQQGQKLGVGLSVVSAHSIDTTASKHFIGPQLAKKVAVAVDQIMTHRNLYQQRLGMLSLNSGDIGDLLRKKFGKRK